MGYLMGIDLGTSSVKALLADEKGRMKGIGQKAYEILTPVIGYAQQNPQDWWSCTKQAVSEALCRSGIQAAEIDGIGVSGQMHGLVALNKAGETVGPAIIHLDQRSLEERREIIQLADELLFQELLNQPSTGMLLCSLLWLKRNRPEIYDCIDMVMSPKDYIRYRLTGVICTEYSDASATLAFSVKKREWCLELMQRLDIRKDIWPNVCESFAVVGTVSREAANETGLFEGTKVIAGGGDCAAQMVGNGVVEEGIMACNIGTASQLAVVVKQPIFDPHMCCQLWCHALPGTWLFQGGALNGGNTLSWLKNKVLRDSRSFAELDAEALTVPVGCEGLFFLPFLSGERTPYNDPKARGVFFGLGLKHDQSHLVRAAMEGVMYNLCECRRVFDEMKVAQIKVISSGGGAKGFTWKQIQADMLNMPVYTTQTQEEACLGAVILTAVGLGYYADVYEACQEIVIFNSEVTEPIAEHVKIYREGQEIYHDLYFQVKALYQRL